MLFTLLHTFEYQHWVNVEVAELEAPSYDTTGESMQSVGSQSVSDWPYAEYALQLHSLCFTHLI